MCNIDFPDRILLPCRRPQFDSWVGKIPWRRDRLLTPIFLGFPVAQLVKNLIAMWETWVQSLGWQCGTPGFDPWVGKIPWRRERLPTPV